MTDEVLADLHFVMNSFVFYEDLEKDLDAKLLDPIRHEVWEFRSYVKRPFLRLFGSFAVPSIFVGTDFRVRDDLEKKRGPRWNRVIRETRDNIRDIFAGDLPYDGPSFRSYFA